VTFAACQDRPTLLVHRPKAPTVRRRNGFLNAVPFALPVPIAVNYQDWMLEAIEMRIFQAIIPLISRLWATYGAIAAKLAAPLESSDAKDKSIPDTFRLGKDERVVIVLYDNTARLENLRPAWGFACLLETARQTILFDTGGDGGILLDNARKMGIDFKEIDAIFISHIHGDHTGGLDAALRRCGRVPVYLPADTSESFLERVRAHHGEPVLSERPVVVSAGVMTTGTLPAGGEGEQGLCFETASGWILITGCAHPGVVKMVTAARRILPRPVYCVIGGFHMRWHSRRKIDAAISALKRLGVICVGPCHCTGKTAEGIFAEHFGEGYLSVGAGTILRFTKRLR